MVNGSPYVTDSEVTPEGRLIIASHHDLRSAKELFNQVLLINRETVAFGETETLINDELLEATFDTAPDK